MLRSFRFSNHRSFRDETELLLLPAYDKDRQAVPVVAVYGANAAGKSNVLDALAFMTEAVHNSYRSWPPQAGVPRRPFALPRSDAESFYVAELLLDGVRHTYGFSVSDDRVGEEWLYAYPHRNRKRVVFERHQSKVVLGSTVTEQRGKLDVLSDLTRPNALFLSLATQLGLPETTRLYLWFANQLRFVGPTPTRSRYVTSNVLSFLGRAPHLGRRLVDLLRAADLGLQDMVVDDGEYDVHYDDDHQPVGRIWLAEPRLRFLHGDLGEMGLGDQSDGTVRWLWLLLDVLSSLDDGGTTVVDELDASLHPELTARLLRLFQSPDLNPLGAQLIFTTHDATLLGSSFGEELLKRDQVWFVEKDTSGNSRLYPLTDFHPRQDENRERRYLNGAYGAIPITSDVAVERAITKDQAHDVAAP